MIEQQQILEAVVGAWCDPKNERKVIDPDLVDVIVDNVMKAIVEHDCLENSAKVDPKSFYQL